MDLVLKEVVLAVNLLTSTPNLPADVSVVDLTCMAKNIYFEARGEKDSGRAAVAFVTLNRVHSDNFPDSICEVVQQDEQFSWLSDGKSDIPKDWPSYRRAMLIGAEVMADAYLDPTDGATHYFAHELVNPYWADVFTTTAQIGGHTFKRP